MPSYMYDVTPHLLILMVENCQLINYQYQDPGGWGWGWGLGAGLFHWLLLFFLCLTNRSHLHLTKAMLSLSLLVSMVLCGVVNKEVRLKRFILNYTTLERNFWSTIFQGYIFFIIFKNKIFCIIKNIDISYIFKNYLILNFEIVFFYIY